ncbi:hypothetical protein ACQP0C_12080 [Nocardia sp. CA-129566]|uniref:hypothetical protein n=1 Tax=Nocardia sp. CA-129566 TaxID=3239976 RepID=UPI003D9941AB
MVAKYLPKLDYAVGNRTALGRRHIDAVLDHVEGLAARAGEADRPGLWEWIAAVVFSAAIHDPDRLLALAAKAIRHTSIYRMNGAARARPTANSPPRRSPYRPAGAGGVPPIPR